MFKWKLDRPLAVFDIEATGVNPRSDRIVELCVVRIHPDGSRDTHTFLINPEVPMPEDAQAIHGISDADVADCPKFADVAQKILGVFEGCDLAGYNATRFDIPMLEEEFSRAGITFDVASRRIIDPQRIYHKREPRDLSAALAYYCGEMHLNAHGAEADVLATVRVMEGQFEKYPDLPTDMDELAKYCDMRRPSWVDRIGRLKWQGGEVVLNFGKKKGTPLRYVVENDASFLKWMLRSDFPSDTLEIVRNAVEGKWPEPPAAANASAAKKA